MTHYFIQEAESGIGAGSVAFHGSSTSSSTKIRMHHTHFLVKVCTVNQRGSKEETSESYNDKIKWEEVITTVPILASQPQFLLFSSLG